MEWNYSSEAGGWVTQADAGDFYTALEQWRIYGVPIEVQVYAMTGSAPHKVIYFTNFLEWFDNGSDYFSWTTVNYEEWGHVYLYEFTFVRTNNGFTTGMLDAGELAWENDIPSVPNPANTAPKDLAASAAIGTSTRYARADHIHAKPTYTASDVGALPSNTTFVSSVNGQSGAVTVAVPSAATATPSDLGTAAVGTSVKYAREDHVHNKPSAADVGALAAPVSASSGDVLTYDGSAWGAASAPTGIYWCTYGTTTNAEIETAYAANKLVCVKYDNHVYVLVGRGSATSHSFSLPYYVSTPAIYSVHCSGNVWNASSKILIGAPSSPSAGDTLVYDGSAWVAQNPTPEVTVSSAGAVTQALDAGKIYHFTGAVTSLTITLNAVSGVPAQYHFDFTEGSTAFDPTLPSSVVLPDGHTWEADTHYEVDILNNYAVVVGWTVS